MLMKIKIQQLKNGIIPIYEPGLSSMVLKNIKNENLEFSPSLKESIQDASVIFIALETPMGNDGSADLQHVISMLKK
jgi:UDPglucose 6-dehydrogenase